MRTSLRRFVLLLGLFLFFNSSGAWAQGAAFSCDGTFYQIRQVGTTSQLFRVNRSAAAYTTEPVIVVSGSNDLGVLLNGLAYNSQDGYLYAVTSGGATGSNAFAPIYLYKIGQGGIVQVGGANVPIKVGANNLALTVANGTFDKAGNYYFSSQNSPDGNGGVVGGANFNLYKLTPSSATPTVATAVTLAPQTTFYDLAYNPADNSLYGVNWVGSLFKINQSTGAVATISTAPTQQVPYAVGSTFFDIAGNLFGYNNGSTTASPAVPANFYQINTTTGAYAAISAINTASVSDGASCINPNFFVDVVKQVTSVSRTATAAGLAGQEYQINFQFRVKNTGTQTLERVQVSDFLWSGSATTTQAGTAFSAVAGKIPSTVTVNNLTVTNDGTAALVANSTGTTSYTGISSSATPIRAGLLTGTQSLTAGQSATINLTATVTYAATTNVPTANVNNQAYATALGNATTANAGYRLDATNGTLFSPLNGNLSAIDNSTNSAALPIAPNDDVASPSPISFQTAIFGNVFEDANYGGGAGRSQSASNGEGVSAARVELYLAGAFVAATTTDAAGNYSFINGNGVTLAAATTYQVRVVNSTVVSNRPGSVVGLLPAQTYLNGNVNRVGGEAPAEADYGPIATGTLPLSAASTTQEIQSVATVATPAAGPLVGVDFGFNFDLIVNTNDAGQGSLRQFILNSNALGGESSLAQVYTSSTGATTALTTALESSIFMIPNGQANVAGQRSGLTSQVITNTGTGTAATVLLAAALPAVTGSFTAIDGSTQTRSTSNSNAAGTTAGAESTGPEIILNLNGQTGLAFSGANEQLINLGVTGSATASSGVLVNSTATGLKLTTNTIYNNGVNVSLLSGASGNTLFANVIRSSTRANGGGIVAQSGTNNNVLSANTYGDNNGLAIDLTNGTTNDGDGVTLNDNGDADTGANGLLNFPIIKSATILGGNLTIVGYARANSKIEFYSAAPDPSGFGEGRTYLGGSFEGSTVGGTTTNLAVDTDAGTTDVSYSGLINGLNQGSDNAVRGFTFVIPVGTTTGKINVGMGTVLTSTATVVGTFGTSEFSGNVTVVEAPFAQNVTNLAIANNSAVVLNPNLSGTANGTNSSGDANTIASYTIVTLPALGKLTYVNGGTVTTVTSNTTITAAQLSTLAYTPVAGSTATQTFTYNVTDANGIISSVNRTGTGPNSFGDATYTIPVSNTPIAVDDEAITPVSTSVTFEVTRNDLKNGLADIAPGTIDLNPTTPGIQPSFTVAGEGTYSTLAAPTGSVTFTPVAGFAGVTNTPYTVQNTDGVISSQANLVVRVESKFDVATTISVPATVLAGTPVTISGATANKSLTSVSSVQQYVQLPVGLTGGFTYTGSAGGASYNSATGLVTFAQPTYAAGQLSEFTITFTAPLTGPFTATASVATPPSVRDIDLTNNTASAVVSITPQADVFTTISGPTTNPAEGDLLTYIVTTGNKATYQSSANTTLNSSPAMGLVQTVTVPSGISGVFVTNGGVYDATARTVTFPAVNLIPGQTVNNTISFVAPAVPTLQLTANVPTTDEPTTATQANNTASTSILTVQPAVTTVAKQANLYVLIGNGTLLADETFSGPVQVTPDASNNHTATYTVKQGNNGPAAADNVQTVVMLPAGLNPADVTVGGVAATTANYNAATGQLILPALSGTAAQVSGASQTYTIMVKGPVTAAVITATASVTATSPDPVAANNMATTQTEIAPTADVAITLVNRELNTGGVGVSVAAGRLLSYAVQTQNTSAYPARNVQQTAALPTGLSVATLQLNGATGTLAGGLIIFGSGATASTYNVTTGVLTLPVVTTLVKGVLVNNTITFPAPAYGTTNVAAAVRTSTPETDLSNNTASVLTGLNQVADLTVSLAGPAQAVKGNLVAYVVTTTNNGPSSPSEQSTATQTTTVQLPTGLTGVTVSNTTGKTNPGGAVTGTYDATTGVVTFLSTAGVPDAGQSVEATISFVMPDVASLNLAAAVALTSPTNSSFEANLDNNSARLNTATVAPVLPSADLATTFTAVPAASQLPGATVTYKVQTANATSAAPAQNPVQLVTLPAGLTVTGLKLGINSATTSSGTLSPDAKSITFGSGATAATYDIGTGLLTIPVTAGTLTAGASVENTISFPMPNAALALTANSVLDNLDSAPTNNLAQTTTTIGGQANVALALSGPAFTTAGTTVSYAISGTNTGPVAAANTTVKVTLPAGVTSYTVNGTTITGASGQVTLNPQSQAVPVGGALRFVVSFTAPSADFSVAGQVTATGDTDVSLTSNNVATVTTGVNIAPVANDVVNGAQSPQSNTAARLALSPLSATDANGSTTVTTYTLRSLPNPAAGTLYTNGAAVSSLPAGGLAVDPATLSFDPAATFVGTAAFTYSATDNGNGNAASALTSNLARYTIQVGQDNPALYAVNAVRGANAYVNGDEIARVYDYNGGIAVGPTAAGKTIFSPNPADRSANYASGVTNNGVRAATTTAASTTLLTGLGLSLSATTGRITVTDRTLLKAGTYTLTISTTDANGGITAQDVTFTIGANPLPVELTAFEARAVKADVVLSWTTATEKNNDHFVIERSLDGTRYTKVGQVAGQGSKSTPTSYSLTDPGIGAKASGSVYYRLQQVDKDGTSAYSPVRVVSFPKAAAPVTLVINLFPVPVPSGGGAKLDLSALPSASRYSVRLTDLSGRTVGQFSLSGGQVQPLELSSLASGSYLLTLSGQDAQGQNLRLVKRFTKE